MRTTVLVGLAALVGLAGVAFPVAAQEVTAEVRTWSGESWRLMEPSLEVFYTIMPKGKAGRGARGQMQSRESGQTNVLGQTLTGELGADPQQGHKRGEFVILFREGIETQIAFGRIKSLQFFRQPVEKSPLPPYVAATHFRYFATAELVDGSRVEGDYINLGTTVLRGMTPEGRVDIPWEDVENVSFASGDTPEPTRRDEKVALAATVITELPVPRPIVPPPARRQIAPSKKAPEVPKPPAQERQGTRERTAPEATPTIAQPTQEEKPQEEKKLALRSPVAKPPTPQVPELLKRDVVFDFDSLLLSDDAKVALNTFGTWLKANPDTTIVMKGRCEKRERGTNAYNLALGELRFKAIREYLVAAGIDGHRISTGSDDEERPVVLGPDEAPWQCNRHVHLEVVKLEGPVR